MSLIDLGYTDAGGDVPRAGRPHLDRQLARRVAAGLAVLLCLVSLGASARPQQRGMHLVWSVDDVGESDFTAAGDAVFVISHSVRQVLTSHSLADGKVRWRRDLTDTPYLLAVPGAGVLVLPSGQEAAPDGDSTGYTFTETAALDAATGRELWRIPGSPADSGANGTMLIEQHEPHEVTTAGLHLVDLTDGRTIWSTPAPGVQSWVEIGTDPDRPDRLATVTGTGRVRVLSMTDGTEVAAGHIPWVLDAGQAIYTFLQAHGDAFYALRWDQQGTSATAYANDSLARLWTVTRPATGDDGAVHPCGPVLCMSGSDGLSGLDWATGKVRWHRRDQVYTGDAGTGLILSTSSDSTHRSLIDEATGRIIAGLDGKQATGRVDGPVIAIAPSRAPAGRTVVHQIDPRTGETFLLGATEAVDDSGCTLAQRYLLCRTLLGKLTVTAVG